MNKLHSAAWFALALVLGCHEAPDSGLKYVSAQAIDASGSWTCRNGQLSHGLVLKAKPHSRIDLTLTSDTGHHILSEAVVASATGAASHRFDVPFSGLFFGEAGTSLHYRMQVTSVAGAPPVTYIAPVPPQMPVGIDAKVKDHSIFAQVWGESGNRKSKQLEVSVGRNEQGRYDLLIDICAQAVPDKRYLVETRNQGSTLSLALELEAIPPRRVVDTLGRGTSYYPLERTIYSVALRPTLLAAAQTSRRLELAYDSSNLMDSMVASGGKHCEGKRSRAAAFIQPWIVSNSPMLMSIAENPTLATTCLVVLGDSMPDRKGSTCRYELSFTYNREIAVKSVTVQDLTTAKTVASGTLVGRLKPCASSVVDPGTGALRDTRSGVSYEQLFDWLAKSALRQ